MQSTEKQALLFLCHRCELSFAKHFKSLEKAFRKYGDAYFLFDATNNSPPPHLDSVRNHTFSLNSLKDLGYRWMHDKLMPGHVAYPVLGFARQHPEYAHFWVIEYDVRLTGPWTTFFSLAGRSDADYIGTHLVRFQDQPQWDWWPSFSHPTDVIQTEALVRSFGPFYRLSRRAVHLLDTELKGGCVGHFEVLIPSLLKYHGLSLVDLRKNVHFDSLSRWDFYTPGEDEPTPHAKPSSFRFLPVMQYPGLRPFTLYHPVKPHWHGISTLIHRVGSAFRKRN